jgi:hypothetical protein
MTSGEAGTGCSYCSGALAVPTLHGGDYDPCPWCVVDAGVSWVVLDHYGVGDDDDAVKVYCCRCPLDVAVWTTTYGEQATSVEKHVQQRHVDAVGPARPDGTPVWVPGVDWWVVSDEDLTAMFGFLDDQHPW